MPLLTNIETRDQYQPTTSGLLNTYAERQQRNEEKTLRILRFLRITIYSTTELLAQVMELKTRSAIWKTLKGMEKKKLLRSLVLKEMNGKLIWGITAAGQEAALQDGDEPANVVFNAKRVSLHGLQHYLSLQEIHLRGEKQSWSQFIYCDRRVLKKNKSDDLVKDAVRPDLIAIDPLGRRAAIESERTLKRPTRYLQQVIPGHVRRMNADEYSYVVWICSDAADEQTLRGFLTTVIQELRKQGDYHLDKTTAGVAPFNITNLEKWPKF